MTTVAIPRTIYVFGNGALAFDDFLRLYAPLIEAALARPDTAWSLCDFRGVDTLAMEYLKTRTASVTVFHVGERPRYLPDRRATQVERWQLRGGFADDTARDDAARAASTHYLAYDRFSTPRRPTGTAAIIERCRTDGMVALIAEPDRALAMGRVRADIDRAPVHATARAFAHILIDLFPPWFDFAPEHLAVLRWSLGLHLVVAGPTRDRHAEVAVMSTSDSRQMAIAVTASSGRGRVARIDMHYQPSDAQRACARDAIALALHALYPDQPIDAALAARAGELFADA